MSEIQPSSSANVHGVFVFVLPTCLAAALLFPSSRSISFPLTPKSLLSVYLYHMVITEQYLEKSSILCCKSSMAWLTVPIFGESVIFIVNPPWYGNFPWHG